MHDSWQAFWQKQSKPLHHVDDDGFYRRHAAELALLTGDPSGRAVLDLGCGDGALFRYLGFDRASRYAGVDFSRSMLEVFQAREPGVRLIEGSAIDIPTTEKFDLVFSNGLVQYFDRRQFERHLRAVLALLNRGGIYVCGSVPGKERLPAWIAGASSYPPRFSLYRSLREAGAFLLGRPPLGQWYSLWAIRNAAARAGAIAEVYGSLSYLYRYHVVFRARD